MVGTSAWSLSCARTRSRGLAVGPDSERPGRAGGRCGLGDPADPPHIKKPQIESVNAALRQGDPEALGFVTKGTKQKMHEFTETAKQYLPGT